jgi:hypothetical protein
VRPRTIKALSRDATSSPARAIDAAAIDAAASTFSASRAIALERTHADERCARNVAFVIHLARTARAPGACPAQHKAAIDARFVTPCARARLALGQSVVA